MQTDRKLIWEKVCRSVHLVIAIEARRCDCQGKSWGLRGHDNFLEIEGKFWIKPKLGLALALGLAEIRTEIGLGFWEDGWMSVIQKTGYYLLVSISLEVGMNIRMALIKPFAFVIPKS